MFTINQGKGFVLKFANGNQVSVQWGHGNYCSRRWDREEEFYGMKPVKLPEWVHESRTAEVAAWNEEGEYSWESDTVEGYCSPEKVAAFIQFVATSDLQVDRFEWEGKTTQGEEQ